MDLAYSLMRGLFGLSVLVGICWLVSLKRGNLNIRLILSGLALQIFLGWLLLKVPYAALPISWVSNGFVAVLSYADAGAAFLFGWLGAGPEFWNQLNNELPDNVGGVSFGIIFAVKVLPTIIFFSGLTALLYYIGILQLVVRAFAWLLQRSMGLSGAESLAAATNVFAGQAETPIMIRPYLQEMTRSELLCLMTGGMATIAGSVFGAYVWILGGSDAEAQSQFALHLITASILSAPAAVVCAKILLPETEPTDHNLSIPKEDLGVNAFDAVSRGLGQGMQLSLMIAAMLIGFVAFIAMFNGILGWAGEWSGLNGWIASWTGRPELGLSLEVIFGFLFAPVAWVIGVEYGQLMNVGQLLGLKLAANEFVAYQRMAELMADGTLQDPRAITLTTYALCGFANFGSVGILIGTMASLAPERNQDTAQLVLRALLGGTVACLMTACVAGMFVV